MAVVACSDLVRRCGEAWKWRLVGLVRTSLRQALVASVLGVVVIKRRAQVCCVQAEWVLPILWLLSCPFLKLSGTQLPSSRPIPPILVFCHFSIISHYFLFQLEFLSPERKSNP